MANGVSAVKQAPSKIPCTLSDLEVCIRNIDLIYGVGLDGEPVERFMTYDAEAVIAYYACNNCRQDWSVTAVQDREAAWKLAEEHLNVG